MAVMTNTTDTSGTSGTIDLNNKIKAPVRTRPPGRRVLRVFVLGIGVVFALIVGLVLAGASYEALSSMGDAAAYPPPGRLVDVGGYRLHIQCVGTASSGSPTVVLDAGLGGSSLDWDLVQKEIGQTNQVCAYDRAGMGWSDTGPQPRAPGQIARELHTLLANAGIPGPYVLVGHSLAGKNVRMFALHYPDQVAGMVLVDARSEYVDQHTSPAEADAFQAAMRDQGNQYSLMRRLGLARLLGAGQSGVPAMSEKIRFEIALLTTGQRAIEATTAESLERATDDVQLQAAPSIGDRPLIVLAAGQNMHNTMLPTWPEAQSRLAALSTNGRLIVVEGSGHSIQSEHPDVVIDAVRQVVAQVRGH
ncbi:MAG: alpha/beta hydrolase [Chloroflexota bacterium]